MKKWVLCCLCTIVLGLASTGLASASPAPSAADRQFLASLAQSAEPPVASPAPLPWEELAKPNHCGPTWCTAEAKAACESQDLPGCTPGCTTFGCNSKECTDTCFCLPDIYCL
jgi:hypothetical protein